MGDYYSNNFYKRFKVQEYFHQCALSGDRVFQFKYAQSLNDRHLPLKKSYEWYLKSANQGYFPAYHKLGWICFNGFNHIKVDFKKGTEFYNKALELENNNLKYDPLEGEIYNELGLAYLQGLGEDKDDKKAFEMFYEGYEYNNFNCTINLAKMYDQGIYVKQDKLKAFNILYFIILL